MPKIIGTIESAADPKKIKGKVGGDNKIGNSVVSSGKITNQINLTKRKIRQKQLSLKFW